MNGYRTASKEDGVALVTVLMIVAAMSTVAIMLSSAVLSSTQRSKALDASAQADWFMVGAQEFAQVSIEQLVSQSGGALFDGMPGLAQPITFPVEGGLMSLSGRDASNCFNLNALASQGDGDTSSGANEDSPSQDFIRLVEASDLEGFDAEGAVSALRDWIDPDQTPGLGGAEDSYYASLSPAYRTSGQPLDNLSELHAIRYFDAAVIAALEPMLCALPSETQSPLNINTITEAQAPLLVLAMSGALSEQAARDVIFQRPPGGWDSVEDMLALPDLANIDPELRRTTMLSTRSSHIGVQMVIEYRNLRRVYDMLLRIEDNGRVSAIRRERRG